MMSLETRWSECNVQESVFGIPCEPIMVAGYPIGCCSNRRRHACNCVRDRSTPHTRTAAVGHERHARVLLQVGVRAGLLLSSRSDPGPKWCRPLERLRLEYAGPLSRER